MLGRNAIQAVRSFSTSAARRGGHGGGVPEPGDNLPFSIKKWRVLTTFSIFFGTAAAFPFWFMKRAADRGI